MNVATHDLQGVLLTIIPLGVGNTGSHWFSEIWIVLVVLKTMGNPCCKPEFSLFNNRDPDVSDVPHYPNGCQSAPDP